MLPTLAFAESRLQDIQTSGYKDDITLLYNLNIVQGDENGNYNPDNLVNRIEFATILYRMMYDVNIDSVYTPDTADAFSDIDASHWGYKTACFMRSIGIVQGKGNNQFGPNDRISLNDALKMIVVALGHDVVAQSNGGYPHGYLLVASSCGIYKDASAIRDVNALTRAEVAYLCARALNVESLDTEPLLEGIETTFLKMRDIELIEGRVTSTYDIALNGVIEKNQIMIGQTLYNLDIKHQIYDSSQLIGSKVKIYRDIKTDNIKHISVVNRGESVVIPAKNITVPATTSKYSYTYEENNKKKVVELHDPQVIYNGRLLITGDITNARLNPSSGEVRVLDSNGDGRYDLIIITDCITYALKTIRDDTIYGLFGKNLYLKDKEYKIYLNNNEIALKDLIPGDVLSVATDVSGKISIINVSRDKLQGAVEAIDTSASEYQINDEMYTVNSSYSKEKDAYMPLELGFKGTYYFDVYGEIVYATTEYGDEGGGTDPNQKTYGLLREVSLESGIRGTIYVEILTTDNTFEIFEISDFNKFKLGRLVGSDYKISKTDSDEAYSKLSGKYNSVITYEAEGQTLTKLCLPSKSNDADNISLDKSGSAAYQDRVINPTMYVDVNTACFYVPKSEKYTDFIVGGKYNNVLSNGSVNYEIYDLEKDGRIGAIVSHPTSITRLDNSKNQYETYVDMASSPVLYVNGRISRRNEDGDFDEYVYGYQNGKYKEVRIGDGVNGNSDSLSVIKKGSVIQYELNDLERSRALTSDEPSKIVVVRKHIDFTENNAYSINTGLEGDFFSKVVNNNLISGLIRIYDKVKYVSEGAIKLTSNSEGRVIMKDDNIIVMEYDSEINEFSMSHIDNIEVGMDVYVRIRAGKTIEIVHIKN